MSPLIISMKYSLFFLRGAVALTTLIVCHSAVNALSVKDSIVVMLHSNSDLGASIENYKSVNFELQQAQGLSGPRIDLKATVGTSSVSDIVAGKESGLTAVLRQPLFDSFGTRSKVQHYKARLDGAAYRVLDRTEVLSLSVVRDYLQILQQQRILSTVQENLAFYSKLEQQIRTGMIGGTLTQVELLQAKQHVQSAKIRLMKAKEDLVVAQNSFIHLVGQPIGHTSPVPVLSHYLPGSLNEALSLARLNNPSVQASQSDVNAAHSLVREARAHMGPKLDFVAEAKAPNFLHNDDNYKRQGVGVSAELRWNLFDSGISLNKARERVTRGSEQDMLLHSVLRQLEADIAVSWDRRDKQRQLLQQLQVQSEYADKIATLYLEQFTVGRRALLDVLDAQDSKFQADLSKLSAQYTSIFAEYRLLASMGDLLNSLDLPFSIQNISSS